MPEPISRPNSTAADAIACYGPEEPRASTAENAPPAAAPVVTEQWLVDRVKTSGPRPRHLEKAEVVRPRTNADVARCKSAVSTTGAMVGGLLAGAGGKSPMAVAVGTAAGKIAADAVAAMICDPPDTGAPARSPDAPASAPNDVAR